FHSSEPPHDPHPFPTRRSSDLDDPGYILSIRRYHLRNEMIPSGVSIFKIPQDVGTVFVTKTFVESARVNQLRGGILLDPTVGIFEGLIRPELNLVPDLP